MRRSQQLPGEFELIARYFAPLAFGFPGAFALTDDAAVISPAVGHELVANTDAIGGGVHFFPGDPPDLVARKALHVNLSDIAAEGAIGRAYMLDLILPRTAGESWIADFTRGLAEDQRKYGVHLIGGDTDMTPGLVTIATGRMIRRNGARPGDVICVTGTIGDAVLGLAVLDGGLSGLDDASAAFLTTRYRLPQPRVSVGPQLVGLATAALDVSDGLIADLRHICEVSDVAAIVEAPRVPLSPAARAVIAAEPGRLATALTGGDDYEILFTASPDARTDIARLSAACGVPITEIGRIVSPAAAAGQRIAVLDAAEHALKLDHEGWTHF